MKALHVAFALFGLIASSRPGCGPYKPEQERKEDEHKPLRPECNDGQARCYTGCIKREESRFCPDCCFEQLILCDDGQKYSFAKCETVEQGR